MQPLLKPRARLLTATDNQSTRSSRCVASEVRPGPSFRSFGVATAALVAVGGYVHFCLYRHGYRTIPKIGVGFLLQVVASVVVTLALVLGPRRLARVAHITDRVAATLTACAAAALAAGTLLAFALTRTPDGLFNFQERGLEPAPQALIALVAEVGVLVALGGWLVAAHLLRRPVRMAPNRSA